MNARRVPWLVLVALCLLAIEAVGVFQLLAVQQQALIQALQSLFVWLPVFYGVVPWRCPTATPAKVGELSRDWRHHLPCGELARAMVQVALISLLVWANETLVLWLLVRLLAPAAITPGGIGVNEVTTVMLLGQQRVTARIALMVAMLWRLITLWSMVALAAAIGVVPLTAGAQRRQDS